MERTNENEQFELLMQEQNSIKKRLDEEDYKDQKEKELLETILEENYWSLYVIMNTMQVNVPIDPIKLLSAMSDRAIEDCFLFCIMQNDEIQTALHQLRDAGIDRMKKFSYDKELEEGIYDTVNLPNITKALEDLRQQTCTCGQEFCKMDTDNPSCRKKIIPILESILPYEKFVVKALNMGQDKFKKQYKRSFDWIMGILPEETEHFVCEFPISFEDSCKLRDKNMAKIRHAIQLVVAMPIDKAIEMYKKFRKLNINDLKKDLQEREIQDADPSTGFQYQESRGYRGKHGLAIRNS